MGAAENKIIRRRILLALYETYQKHPHIMFSPKEMMDAADVTYDELRTNVFYLEERGFVECLKGFGTALFGAARLTAQGVDIVEDAAAFNELFPAAANSSVTPGDELSELFERISLEARMAPLGQDDIDSLTEEIEFVRRLASRKTAADRMDKIETLLGWIKASFDGNNAVLRDIDRLMELIREK
jgi:hypothetical protein